MLNSISIMGNCTADPVLRKTQNGVPVCRFTLACDRDYRNADGSRDTDFVDVVAWRQHATFASDYLSKGRMVVVNGALRVLSWTDREGNPRKSVEVQANSISFGDSRPRRQEQAVPFSGNAGSDLSRDQDRPVHAYAGAGSYGTEDPADDGSLPF